MGTEDDRTRSGLAYAFLDLVEQHRPPAILLENVPGLLSSNGGKDLGALLGRLGELGYWWSYRILDAQFFGVPQRRRRVFICALHAGAGFGADSPAAVLSVGARCDGHSAAGDEAGAGAAQRPTPGVDIARAITGTSGKRHDDDTDTLIAHSVRPRSGMPQGWNTTFVRPSPDSGGVREADGVAGGSHDRVHPSLRAGGHGSPGIGRDGDEDRLVLSPTLRVGPQRPQDGGPGDTVPVVVSGQRGRGMERRRGEPDNVGDDLLPLGLDSHRYRCCGNGVVSNVSEWIGVRLARAVREVLRVAA